MKQVAPNPWDVIAEKYPEGTTIEGKIKNITDFGIFIGIDEGIDGLCIFPTSPGPNASSIPPSYTKRGCGAGHRPGH